MWDDVFITVLITVLSAGAVGALAVTFRWVRRKVLRARRKIKPSSKPALIGTAAAGRGRALVERVTEVRAASHPEVALAGAVYLDILLYPVDTQHLDNHEWTDIDPLAIGPGGAAYYVGHYLFEDHKRNSYLFSGFGTAADSLSHSLRTLIASEGWVKNELAELETGGQSAISVHLIQRDHVRTSIFTHRGAVSTFGWPRIGTRAGSALSGGGVLFISGFFKTQLHSGLRAALKGLRDQVIVIADPGTIDSGSVDAVQLKNLRDVLQAGQIDVHITGFDDFLRLYAPDLPVRRPRDLAELKAVLPVLAGKLAPLVYIRGTDLPGKLAMITIADGKVCATDSDPTALTGKAPVGSKNAFSAALIEHLLSRSSSDSATVDDLAKECGNVALEAWKEACR